MKCTKAIIPVAGYGTRRLPVSKAVEKCMLPLLNRPIIDYVVEDCLRAGVTDIYFIVSQGGGQQLKKYYSADSDLEQYLRKNNKDTYVPLIMPPKNVVFHYIEQDPNGQYGTSVPVWLARQHVEPDEHVLVIMGDQCLYRSDKGSEAADLIAAVAQHGADSGMIAVPVAEEEVSKYGIIECDSSGLFKRIVEKPKREDAPSNLNNASFYLFNKRMFDYVGTDMMRPRSGEYYLTDPINEFVRDGYSLLVEPAKGEYLDCGTVEGWVAANNFLLSSTN